jgi:hypothetical protein
MDCFEMRIGFSTGAVAFGDFRLGLERLTPHQLYATELSALRGQELAPLVDALADLDLGRYRYVSFHAPSRFEASDERRIVKLLHRIAELGWPIVCHPDAIHETALWTPLARSLCFENLDKRKPIGRVANELDAIFDRFPESSLCLDLGHAWQVDRTMSEAREMIRRFRDRIKQVHVSEVNTQSEHVPLTLASTTAYMKVAEYIPDEAPWIIESAVSSSNDISREIECVRQSFARKLPHVVAEW